VFSTLMSAVFRLTTPTRTTSPSRRSFSTSSRLAPYPRRKSSLSTPRRVSPRSRQQRTKLRSARRDRVESSTSSCWEWARSWVPRHFLPAAAASTFVALVSASRLRVAKCPLRRVLSPGLSRRRRAAEPQRATLLTRGAAGRPHRVALPRARTAAGADGTRRADPRLAQAAARARHPDPPGDTSGTAGRRGGRRRGEGRRAQRRRPLPAPTHPHHPAPRVLRPRPAARWPRPIECGASSQPCAGRALRAAAS
jgi:hypothetical protein